jgi:ACS family sodium-dependent inorganic phosphate cotransporter
MLYPLVCPPVQGISFIGPLTFLLLACTDPVIDSREATVACITAALGLSSFSVAGLYCTHSDIR